MEEQEKCENKLKVFGESSSSFRQSSSYDSPSPFPLVHRPAPGSPSGGEGRGAVGLPPPSGGWRGAPAVRVLARGWRPHARRHRGRTPGVPRRRGRRGAPAVGILVPAPPIPGRRRGRAAPIGVIIPSPHLPRRRKSAPVGVLTVPPTAVPGRRRASPVGVRGRVPGGHGRRGTPRVRIFAVPSSRVPRGHVIAPSPRRGERASGVGVLAIPAAIPRWGRASGVGIGRIPVGHWGRVVVHGRAVVLRRHRLRGAAPIVPVVAHVPGILPGVPSVGGGRGRVPVIVSRVAPAVVIVSSGRRRGAMAVHGRPAPRRRRRPPPRRRSPPGGRPPSGGIPSVLWMRAGLALDSDLGGGAIAGRGGGPSVSGWVPGAGPRGGSTSRCGVLLRAPGAPSSPVPLVPPTSSPVPLVPATSASPPTSGGSHEASSVRSVAAATAATAASSASLSSRDPSPPPAPSSATAAAAPAAPESVLHLALLPLLATCCQDLLSVELVVQNVRKQVLGLEILEAVVQGHLVHGVVLPHEGNPSAAHDARDGHDGLDPGADLARENARAKTREGKGSARAGARGWGERSRDLRPGTGAGGEKSEVPRTLSGKVFSTRSRKTLKSYWIRSRERGQWRTPRVSDRGARDRRRRRESRDSPREASARFFRKRAIFRACSP